MVTMMMMSFVECYSTSFLTLHKKILIKNAVVTTLIIHDNTHIYSQLLTFRTSPNTWILLGSVRITMACLLALLSFGGPLQSLITITTTTGLLRCSETLYLLVFISSLFLCINWRFCQIVLEVKLE